MERDYDLYEKEYMPFCGTWAPAALHSLVQDKTIKPSEAWLLMVIESMTDRKSGCCAINKEIAERMGVTTNRVRQMIRKLKNLGLIQQIGFDGRNRYIKTKWSYVSSYDESFGDSDV